MKKSILKFKYGKNFITLETGEIAKQATSSVIINMDETVVLITVVMSKEETEQKNFFPLTVNYQERTYAVGKFPGSFFRREGRPNDSEILTSRLIDRCIRPLFHKNFFKEIQIIATVISSNPKINPEIATIIGVSSALNLSEIPFDGPIGIAHVGYINNKYCLNPNILNNSNNLLNLKVAGTKKEILMIESESKFLTEKQIINAIIYGHKKQQKLIKNIKKFTEQSKTKKIIIPTIKINKNIKKKFFKNIKKNLKKAYYISNKKKRHQKINKIKKKIYKKIQNNKNYTIQKIEENINKLEKKIFRNKILKKLIRIDNRKINEIRKINIKTGILPRTHGSALFTRGNTQALVTVTLGTEKDAQNIDSITYEGIDRFLLHYNFLPYCVGEISTISSPKRREIGHGNLAKKGIIPIIPNINKFPYTIRVVSEITESNGSSSMATICGTSLALMDAGVPIKEGIAGIAMGLIKKNNKFIILSDIIGDEDKFGDMDFKVAGSKKGITCLQVDIKIKGINYNIIYKTLKQAKKARLYILKKMNNTIKSPKSNISNFAPRIYTIKIQQNKIKDVIGKGGSIIRNLTKLTKTIIEVQDDGIIKIAAKNNKSAELAIQKIKNLTEELKIGKIYSGKVINITKFGAFVKLTNKKEGFIHISQISNKYVKEIKNFLHLGQKIQAKILEIKKNGNIKLTLKNI